MSRRANLGQRLAVVLLGTVVTLAMLLLGLWQMQVFEDQGDRDAARRAAAAPVELLPQIPRDGSVGDVYGRNVTVHGSYRSAESVIVADRDGTRRILTALILADGRALPVVRGTTSGPATPPPDGELTVTGVFLPSEAGDDRSVPDGELSSVRLPVLQQRWAEQLTPGFITQQGSDATAQGLSPAVVKLPSQDGKFRNFGYALQWWVFAAFAVVMTVIWVRTLARRQSVAAEGALFGSEDSGSGTHASADARVDGSDEPPASPARLDKEVVNE